MAFTPDSKQFAFNNRSDKGIQLVDVADGKLVRSFHGHHDNVYGIAFAAEGKTFVSCGWDQTIRVWDVASGKEQRRYGEQNTAVRCLALAPDGKTLTYGTYPDGKAHIWDIAANKELAPGWKANEWCIVSIAYSPDSKKIALGRDVIAIHDVATGKRLNPPPENESRVQQVQYSGDGKFLAVWRDDGGIETWDTTNWRRESTIRPSIGRFLAMAFTPDGKFLTTAEGDPKNGAICNWLPQTGEKRRVFTQEGCWVNAIAYTADGKSLAIGHSERNSQFRVLDTATAQVRVQSPKDTPERDVQPSPDGHIFAFLTSKNTVGLWDMDVGKQVREFGKISFSMGRFPYFFSPDGRMIATRAGHSKEAGIDVEPDIVLWETATGKERLRIRINDGPIGEVSFSRDGRMLATAGRQENFRLWDTATGKELARFVGHRGWINSLAFAPDGKTLASGGADSTVLVWDISGAQGKSEVARMSSKPDELAAFVQNLESDNAVEAYRAIGELRNHQEAAVELLKKRLDSTAAEEKRVAQLINDLDNDEFATREKASAELARLGNAAKAALEQAVAQTTSPEVRRRANTILAKLQDEYLSPDQRVAFRAVEVLEHVATPEARRLLEKLSEGPAGTLLASEAKAALKRLPIGR
jgi:WD40 repeat protein